MSIQQNRWYRRTVVLLMVIALVACGDTDPETAEGNDTTTTGDTDSEATEANDTTTTGDTDSEATEANAESPSPASTEAVEETATGGTPVPRIRFLVPNEAYDPVRTQIGLMLADEWEQLGLQVEVETVDYSAQVETLRTDAVGWDAFVAGYSSDTERFDPDIFLRMPFHCSGVESGTNYGRYCNPDYDTIVNRQGGTLDEESRRDLVWDAQQMLRQEVPAVPLYHLHVLSAWDASSFEAENPFKAESAWYFWAREAQPVGEDTTLRMGQTFDLGSANPFTITEGGNTEYFRLIYDTLTEVAPSGEVVPRAAESWEYTDDTTLVVNLRDDLVFHDSTPVTAHDVAFSFELFSGGEGQAAIYETFLEPIESITATDDYTLEFKLKNPHAPFVGVTLSQILILPQHIWENVENLVAFPNEPAIGSGPFMWGDWIRGREILLNANTAYFDPPNVDSFLGVVYSNADAMFRALASGEIHIHQASLLVAQYDELAALDGMETSELPDIGVYYLGFNTGSGPFADLALRQALANAVPYERFMDALFDNHVDKGYSFIAPANEVWSNTELEPYSYDIDASRAILEEAGYSWDGERLLMPTTDE